MTNDIEPSVGRAMLKIDPEFRDKIPALTDAEFEQLKENILADGEVYEPIVTWNNTIVDGHNRWRIICENWEKLKDKFRTKPMDFADKWEAFEWMYRKQLGRRNLTDEQKSFMIGKMYEARKKSRGGQEKNNNAKKRIDQSGQFVCGDTRKAIAAELGIGEGTVQRAVKFAEGIDAIREQNNEAAERILSGTSGMSKSAVSELSDKTESEIKQVAQDILSGEIKKPKAKQPRPMSPQMKDFTKKMLDVVADMETTDKPYDLDDAICELNGAEDVFFTQIRFVLKERRDVIASDERGREQIVGFIESVIHDLNELKGEI